MPANMTHHTDDADANAAAIMAETCRALRYRALDDAGATERALLALVAAVQERRGRLALDGMTYAELTTIGQELRDLRQCAEALGVGLP